jgi:2-polyprenyl-3-methyl-5-hydroxy-6-metoxy-1,4-benzoquinol methylase
MSLLILKHWSDEYQRSPEILYLQDVVNDLARRVFGEVTFRTWRSGHAEPGLGSHDYVLLLGATNVWITTEALSRLKRAVDDGASAAAPSLITPEAAADEPIYSPRGLEAFERRVPTDAQETATLPISLWSFGAFAARSRDTAVSDLLREPERLPPGCGSAAGWYLQLADYYGEARADLLAYLPDHVEDVLEIGCGRGLTGRLIRERRGCRVTGVEQHPGVAAEAVHHLTRVICGDIAMMEVDGQYDAIVASELLEHVADADAVLRKLKTLLKPAGRIVLSVPNVGHYSVVGDLLAGRWDYGPTGLLCYTHVRFFTRRTLEDWAQRLGFACRIDPQRSELPERFRHLAASLAVDVESLSTTGFYVILEPLPAAH